MHLTYVGHACFLAVSDSGLRILLDPYQPGAFGGKIALAPFREPVDVVVSTHDHLDHFHMDKAFGQPVVVRETATVAGVEFAGFSLPHDAKGGAERGMVTGFRFELDGVVVFHPGDLGRPLTDAEVAAIGHVDVLLVPAGGTFTIDAAGAMAVVRAVKPAIAIPMHCRHPRVKLPLAPAEDFLDLVRGYESAGHAMRITKETLPQPTRVILMETTG